jgi:hypothetical protein
LQTSLSAEALLLELTAAHLLANDLDDIIPNSEEEDVSSTVPCEEGKSVYKTRRYRVRLKNYITVWNHTIPRLSLAPLSPGSLFPS